MTITLAASDAQNDAAGANDGQAAVTLSGTEGNLQIVYTTHRSSTRTPTIDGTGWSTPVLVETLIGVTNARRAVAMWWRVVPAAAGTTVTAGWTTDPGAVVTLGYEYSTNTAGGTWSFDGSASSDSDSSSVTSLASGSVTPTNNEAVAIDGLVFRNGDIAAEDSYSNSFIAGAGTNEGTGVNALSGTSGYKIVDTTPAAMPTTASWTTSALATSLIGAWSVAAAAGDITGTVNVTQADQTLSAAGQLGYSGTLAVTQADQTVTAAGQLGSTGTLAVTQDDQIVSASGTVTGAGEITGSLAVTQADQTVAASGQLGYSGSLAATQADQSVAAAGWIEVTGTVGAVQADQTSAAAGQLGSTGTLAATQDDQTVAAAGWIAIFGTVTVTQADQAMTAAGFFGEIPVPAGQPATVQAGAHATTAAARHTATVDPGGHRITVPAGTHAVEVH